MKSIDKIRIAVTASLIRLFKGEQIMNFLVKIGGALDISAMGLMNIVFVALFSSQKTVHKLPSFDKLLKPYGGSRTFRKWFSSSTLFHFPSLVRRHKRLVLLNQRN